MMQPAVDGCDVGDIEGSSSPQFDVITLPSPPAPPPVCAQCAAKAAPSVHVLREFDPATMLPDNATAFFVGKRGGGKTTLVANIMKAKQHLPYGVVVSATEEANEYWAKHVPARFIHKKYNKGITSRAIAMQRALAKSAGQDETTPMFMLYDDIMYDRSFPNDEETRELFMNGRHYKIFLMLTAQYCMDLPPALRANIDFVFILQDHIQRNKDRLYQCYAGVFSNYADFLAVLEKYTSGYGCIVIDNTARSNKVDDVVFWYRADKDPGDFRVGGDHYWGFGCGSDSDCD